MSKIEYRIYGGSHEKEVGVEITGIEKGKSIDVVKLAEHLRRRKPKGNYSTSRVEDDLPIIKCGIQGGKVVDDKIVIEFKNKDIDNSKYDELNLYPRPSHADYVSYVTSGKIAQGGGAFSGRMTVCQTAMGGIAEQLLNEYGIKVYAYINSIGKVKGVSYKDINVEKVDFSEFSKSEFPLLDETVKKKMQYEIKRTVAKGDSIGGSIECVVFGVKAGQIGGALYDGIEGNLAKALYSIPAVKGIEFGDGFNFAEEKGSKVMDEFYFDGKEIRTYSNHNGGINGGISNGMPITMRVCIKPVPSITFPMRSVNLQTHENTVISLSGRFDSVIIPRAVVVVESVVAFEILRLIKEREND